MGGHYVTGYTKHIVAHERENAERGMKPRVEISSAIIVDGYIDATQQFIGYYTFFCENWAGDGRKYPLMNRTACENMFAAIPECQKLGSQCRFFYDIETCKAANEVCEETLGEYFMEGVVPGGWDPYDSEYPSLIASYNTSDTKYTDVLQTDIRVRSLLYARTWTTDRNGSS
jgi:hypothetical protein